MRIRVPPKRVREEFLLIYEPKGCQKAVNFLNEYYGIRRMWIIVDGKRVGTRKSNGWVACYSENKTFFTKRGLNRQNILHEFFHHLVDANKLVLDGKRTGKTCIAFYENGKATFRKSSLNKQNVTHEFFHHLANCKRLNMNERLEEKEANFFAREFLKVCS